MCDFSKMARLSLGPRSPHGKSQCRQNPYLSPERRLLLQILNFIRKLSINQGTIPFYTQAQNLINFNLPYNTSLSRNLSLVVLEKQPWQIKIFVIFDLHFASVFSCSDRVIFTRGREVRVGRYLLISSEIMLRLYKAFILPHFHYCSMIWHFCNSEDSVKLDTLR